MSEHTPLPWRVNQNVTFSDVVLGLDYIVAKCNQDYTGTQEGFDNAALIVRAVNNHDKLVEALQSIISYLDRDPSGRVDFSEEALEVARTALEGVK